MRLDVDALLIDVRRLLEVEALRDALQELDADVERWVSQVARAAVAAAPRPSGTEAAGEREEWEMIFALWITVALVVGLRATMPAGTRLELVSGAIANPLFDAWSSVVALIEERGLEPVWADVGVDALAFQARVRVLCCGVERLAWHAAPTFTTIGAEWALIVAGWFIGAVLAGARAGDLAAP